MHNKEMKTGAGHKSNPGRYIDFGPFTNIINKSREEDVEYVLYKLSYRDRYLYVKGRSLAGSLILMADGYNSYKPDTERFKEHTYTHLYQYLQDGHRGHFRVHIIVVVDNDDDFYHMLKEEQKLLDKARFDNKCLNNEIEARIPQYNEQTGAYGWIPANAVRSFKKWLNSADRKSCNM